jgi:hypothetical protein
MRQVIRIFLTSLLAWAFMFLSDVGALEKNTHKRLNQVTVEQNKDDLNAYLNSRTWIPEGDRRDVKWQGG